MAELREGCSDRRGLFWDEGDLWLVRRTEVTVGGLWFRPAGVALYRTVMIMRCPVGSVPGFRGPPWEAVPRLRPIGVARFRNRGSAGSGRPQGMTAYSART